MNNHVAIRVEHLGKRYKIGLRPEGYRTLRESLTRALSFPFRLGRNSRPADSNSDFWALKDVSLEIKPGEVVGIIGRNGAGKTTLLKILSRITEPTEGRVEVYGRVGSLLEVGTGFHPELTGRENIYLNGAILGMKKAEIIRKFDEIVAFAEVEKFLDTPVKHYSSGMYVRLAFAVAAHLEPEILLVDEVLAVGDTIFQNKCLGKMNDVAKEGRTVFFVSHNMSVISKLCTRAIFLDNGMMKADGAAANIIESYIIEFSDQVSYSSNNLLDINRSRDFGVLLKFKSIALASENNILRMWEPVNLDLEVVSYENIEGVTFGISVFSLDRNCLFSSESEDINLTLTFKRNQTIRLSVIIDHPNLPPGTYIIDIGARKGDIALDWLPNVLKFDVSPINSSSWAMRPNSGLRPESTWSLY